MKTQANNHNGLLGILLALFVGVLLVLSLPLLGIVSVIARTTLLVAFVFALIAGTTAYRVSPRFRAWFSAKLDEQPEYKGLRLRDGVALANGHTWLRSEGGRAIVGADDLAQRVLGPLDAVELPEAGRSVELGEPLMILRHGTRRVTLHSPVRGTVVRRNTTLLDQPRQINADPYGSGWSVELREESPTTRGRLHEGNGARAWFQDEVDRLIATVQPVSQVAAMADGGSLVPSLYRDLDEATWRRVHRAFFELNDNEDMS